MNYKRFLIERCYFVSGGRAPGFNLYVPSERHSPLAHRKTAKELKAIADVILAEHTLRCTVLGLDASAEQIHQKSLDTAYFIILRG